MSSYVLMKILESTPTRYDRGIRLISRGTIGRVYERMAEIAAMPGARVLDLGCGTGGLSLACAALGASVVAIDKDPGMLEVAKGKTGSGDVEWIELGAMEIEQLERKSGAVGDSAWVSTRSRLSGTFRDSEIDLFSTETLAMQRLDGRWQVTHIHWSSRQADADH